MVNYNFGVVGRACIINDGKLAEYLLKKGNFKPLNLVYSKSFYKISGDKIIHIKKEEDGSRIYIWSDEKNLTIAEAGEFVESLLK